MSSIANSLVGVAGAVSRHFSGEPADSDDNNGGQNNNNETIGSDDKNSDNAGHQANTTQFACGECDKEFTSAPRSRGEIECSICRVWYCSKCTNFKKTDINGILKRDDVIWACKHCCDYVKKNIKAGKNNDNLNPSNINDLEKKLEKTIEEKITQSISTVVPAVVKECMKSVNQEVSQTVSKDVSQLWTQTLFGSDFPEINPEIKTQKQANKITKSNTNNDKQQPQTSSMAEIVASGYKRAFESQKEEEKTREAKRNNLIIYGVTEQSETDHTKRKGNNCDQIKELLQEIKVEANVTNWHRIGKYEKPKDGEEKEPRPLKITLSNQEQAQKIMDNCYNLKNAPEHMKSYRVRHDLTFDERQKMKELIETANEKTKNSPKWEFKVRGPPWQPEIKRFTKRLAPQNQSD